MSTFEDADRGYIRALTRELKLRGASSDEIDEALNGIHEGLENGSDLNGEFGTPEEYAKNMLPDRSPKQIYGFLLTGLLLGFLGFFFLVLDRNRSQIIVSNDAMVYIPLLLIPIGMGIDFYRYLKV